MYCPWTTQNLKNYLDQKYPAQLEIKDTTDSITAASYLVLLLSLGRMVNFTLPFTSKEMISISTLQTFRSWVVIFHLRRSMVFFLSLSLYDRPGRAPRMNLLFWGTDDFPVSYSNRDTPWNTWNRHSGSFMVDTDILFSNMKSPFHEC